MTVSQVWRDSFRLSLDMFFETSSFKRTARYHSGKSKSSGERNSMKLRASVLASLTTAALTLCACTQMPATTPSVTSTAILSDRAPLQDLLDAGFDLEHVNDDFLFLKSGPALYRCLIIPGERPTFCTRLS
jgi:hypothetical protein